MEKQDNRTAEEILDKIILKIINKNPNFYQSLAEARKEPQYAMIINGMKEYAAQFLPVQKIEKRKIAYKIVESNLSHKAGTNTLSIEEAVNAVVSGMEHVSLLPAQEQSKQEVTEDAIFDMAKEYINTVPGHLQNIGQAYMDGVTKGLSLPQEQKDKVTGVSEKEIGEILKFFVDNYNKENIYTLTIKKLLDLLSSKAVEQKEPDGKDIESITDEHLEKMGYFFIHPQDYAGMSKEERIRRGKWFVEENLDDSILAIRQLKQFGYNVPIYFSKPIQEAEHKQGVTEHDLFNLMGRFYFNLEGVKGEAQEMYEKYGKEFRSLFGEKGKEEKDE